MEILRQAGRLFGFKNRQYETLTEVNFRGEEVMKIRIWRTSRSMKQAQSFDHDAYINEIIAIVETTEPRFWFQKLGKLPHVACIAIVDSKGNGISFYPDWG